MELTYYDENGDIQVFPLRKGDKIERHEKYICVVDAATKENFLIIMPDQLISIEL
jgi:hypothetical protein